PGDGGRASLERGCPRKQKGEIMMKCWLMAESLILAAGLAPAWSQENDAGKDEADVISDRKDVRKDHADLRKDRADLEQDRKDLGRDRTDLKQDRVKLLEDRKDGDA